MDSRGILFLFFSLVSSVSTLSIVFLIRFSIQFYYSYYSYSYSYSLSLFLLLLLLHKSISKQEPYKKPLEQLALPINTFGHLYQSVFPEIRLHPNANANGNRNAQLR